MTTRTLLCTIALFAFCLPEANAQDGYLNWLGRRLGIGWSDGYHVASRSASKAGGGPCTGCAPAPAFPPAPGVEPTPLVAPPQTIYAPERPAPLGLSPLVPSTGAPVPLHPTAGRLLVRPVASVPVTPRVLTNLQRSYFGYRPGYPRYPSSPRTSHLAFPAPASTPASHPVFQAPVSRPVGYSPVTIPVP